MAEALSILKKIPVNAICSDYNMRDGTGLELLEKLYRENNKIPLLLMSGDDDRRIIEAVKRYGATFCCKTDYDLLEKVQAMAGTTKPV